MPGGRPWNEEAGEGAGASLSQVKGAPNPRAACCPVRDLPESSALRGRLHWGLTGKTPCGAGLHSPAPRPGLPTETAARALRGVGKAGLQPARLEGLASSSRGDGLMSSPPTPASGKRGVQYLSVTAVSWAASPSRVFAELS